MIFDHAKNAAEALGEFQTISSDVQNLIKWHHGSFSGSGFATQLDHRISKFGQLFIVSEELSNWILKHVHEKWSFDLFQKYIFEKYGEKSFCEYLPVLRENFDKK